MRHAPGLFDAVRRDYSGVSTVFFFSATPRIIPQRVMISGINCATTTKAQKPRKMRRNTPPERTVSVDAANAGTADAVEMIAASKLKIDRFMMSSSSCVTD